MNANELADKLENTISLGYPSKMESQEVIAMLRQQQAQIEALIKEIKRNADALGTARNEVRNNKALREHELRAILTEVLDDCGLLKKDKQ